MIIECLVECCENNSRMVIENDDLDVPQCMCNGGLVIRSDGKCDHMVVWSDK